MRLIIPKNYLYLLPILMVLLATSLFSPIDKELKDHPFFAFLIMYNKVIHLLAFVVSLLLFYQFNKRQRLLFALPLLYFIFLVFESYFSYRSFFIYPHVFFKIMCLFISSAIFLFYYKRTNVNLTPIMNLLLFAILMQIAMKPSMLSSDAFVHHERGMVSEEVYMLLVPALFFFNRYIVEFDNASLFKFLILSFILVFFQHRTVYVAATAAFAFNMFILYRQNMLNLKRALPTSLLLVFVGVFTIAMAFTYFPEALEKLNQEVSNILNPEEDTTGSGSWRMLQYESYWPYVTSHLFDGMRFSGFELPIQFYHPDANIPYFEDGTGHHFHSFYYDRTFYLGLVGLVIFLIIMLYPVVNVFKFRLHFNIDQLSIVSYTISGFFFGISYDLPTYFWVFVGLTLAFVEKGLVDHQMEQDPNTIDHVLQRRHYAAKHPDKHSELTP
jgi:hypothetical protein